jgi:tripartite-type tricarboxylate transporter receptor subunit TctC
MRIGFKSVLMGVAALAALLGTVPASAQQSVADFYKGKTIDLWVGYSPGGGYDIYARTIARHMGRHIPGNPEIVVKNRPGAGSLLLMNEVYNTLPKDGTAIATVGRGIPQAGLLGNDQAKFDPAKFTWLGSANNEVSICVAWHTTGITKFEQLYTKEMIVGGTGPDADTDAFPKVLNNLLGTKLRLITGYPGGNDVLLAMERGEVQGRCGYSWSSATVAKGDWLKEKKMIVLAQMSTAKHPDIPDIPLVTDLAKDQKTKDALNFIFSRQAWGRPYVAPPGVPADRAKALQDAFMATFKDPKFVDDANKQGDLEINPVSGPEIAKMIEASTKAPKEIIAMAKDALEREDKTEIKSIAPAKGEKKKK